jgi:predicted small lipoprotein YifL
MHLHRLPIGLFLAVLACIAVLAGCGKKEPSAKPDPSVHSETAPPAQSALDTWEGTWNGPEGTYLKLTAGPDSGYEIVIKDLDGERPFEGVGSADQIHFTRDGQQERIRATDGNGTGMKWLAGKSNCLTVKPGEGYCRE